MRLSYKSATSCRIIHTEIRFLPGGVYEQINDGHKKKFLLIHKGRGWWFFGVEITKEELASKRAMMEDDVKHDATRFSWRVAHHTLIERFERISEARFK